MMRYAAAAAAICLSLPGLAFAESPLPNVASVVIEQSDLPQCVTATKTAALEPVAIEFTNDCSDSLRIVKAADCSNCSDQDLNISTSSSGEYILVDQVPDMVGSLDYDLVWSSSTSSGSIALRMDVEAPEDGEGGCTCASPSQAPPVFGAMALLFVAGLGLRRRRR